MYVVTGGAGFIGSNIVSFLAKEFPSQVYVCDRLRHGDKWKNIAKADIADVIHPDDLMAFLDSVAEEKPTIIHMGAISATTETDVDKIIENNLRMSLDLWDWCAKQDCKFIYASSAATYGDGMAGFDDQLSVDELYQLKPLNPYGWSKHIFDRIVTRRVVNGEKAPRQWVGLKFFNVFGPNEYHKGDMKSVVAKYYDLASKGEEIKLFKSHHPDYEDGGQLRDFVYVKDCLAIIRWMIENEDVNGVYNVGGGQARSFADLITALYDACGQKPAIKYIDMPIHLRDKYQYYTQASHTKLREAGCAHRFMDMEDAVKDYVGHLSSDDKYV